MKRFLYPALAVLVVAFLALMAFSVESDDAVSACPTPPPGTEAARLLDGVRAQARFAVKYPCKLPAGERLEGATVTGMPGRQRVELAFDGPFDIKVRQSQVPPAFSPDPAGASRIQIELGLPGVPTATLIERNDGTSDALYHLFWEQQGLFYEVQAFGPPQQRRTILQLATSLQ